MIYTFEIKETKETMPLIEHLKTLKYVKQKKAEKKVLTDSEMAKAVKAAEKSKSIPWEEFKSESKTWKSKITK
jgi:sorbitol-specific phosphotransferase system component IIBC